MLNYKILRFQQTHVLELEMMKHIADGWNPIGGVAVSNLAIFQAIVREEPDPPVTIKQHDTENPEEPKSKEKPDAAAKGTESDEPSSESPGGPAPGAAEASAGVREPVLPSAEQAGTEQSPGSAESTEVKQK